MLGGDISSFVPPLTLQRDAEARPGRTQAA